MSIQSDSPKKPMSPLSQIVQSIFSDNSNIMLAAIISLLLVILFVLLLHVYAKWFLSQAQVQAQARRRHHRRRNSVTVSDVLGPARFHHFHNFHFEDSPISSSPTKGLDPTIIAAIPLFLYEAEKMESDGKSNQEDELECVICLSAFENGELGRSLPKCDHAFHVECIDMWLSSHSNCPICRAQIVVGMVESDSSQLSSVNGYDSDSAVVEIVIDSPSSEISLNENENGGVSDFVSETSSSLLGYSLKRMLSKVFPSSNNASESET